MSRLGTAALVLALGCDRPPIEATDTARSATAADSVVRRVVRYRAEPSALQRVTGPITARLAEQALDSVLAVRVLDVRGDAMPGARVQWQMLVAGPGARFVVDNERTDSAGVSRARLVPGRSASPQVVAANVAGVGRIEFSVAIPVGSVRLEAPQSLWSGETAVVSGLLQDAAGAALEGGDVHWATTDSVAFVLSASDSQRVLVRGGLAGVAEIWAWSGNVRGTARLRVRPVLDLRVRALDDSVPEARLRVLAPFDREIGGSSAQFRERLDVEPDAEVVLHVAPKARDRYHDARIRLVRARDLQELELLLVPRRWRIDAGSYAGTAIPIDAEAALSPVADRAPFWRFAPVSGRGPKTILGWHESRLPIPIAFDRDRSTATITAADSTAFWDIARRMERDLGATFFRPASPADQDAVGVEISGQSSEGHTFTSSTQDGDANDATLRFRTAATLHDAHVVTHELVHLLGFGHSVSWRTVSRPADGHEARLTPEDVAYMQLALALRRSGMRIGFPRLPR